MPGCFLRARGDINFAKLCQRALGVEFTLLHQLDALTVISWYCFLRLFIGLVACKFGRS